MNTSAVAKNRLKAENDELERMVRELSEERFRLIVALKEREDEADALHEANDRLLARMSELFDYVDRGQTANLPADLQTFLADTASKRESEFSRLATNADALERENRKLRSSLKTSRAKAKAAENESARLRAEADDKGSGGTVSRSTLTKRERDEHARTKESLRQMRRSSARLKAKVEELERELGERRHKRALLKNAYKAVRVEYDAILAENTVAEERYAALVTSYDAAVRENTRLAEQLRRRGGATTAGGGATAGDDLVAIGDSAIDHLRYERDLFQQLYNQERLLRQNSRSELAEQVKAIEGSGLLDDSSRPGVVVSDSNNHIDAEENKPPSSGRDQQMEVLRRHLHEAEEDVNDAEATIEVLEGQVRELSATLAAERGRAADAIDAAVSEQGRLRAQLSESGAADVALFDAEAAVRDLTAENQRLRAALGGMATDIDADNAALAREMSGMEARVRDSNKRVRDLESALTQLLPAANSEAWENLIGALVGTASEIGQVEHDLRMGAHLSHALGTERRQLVGELESVDASLAALRATTEGAAQRRAFLRRRREALEEALAEVSGAQAEAESQRTRMDARLRDLSSRLAPVEAQFRDVLASHERMHAFVASLTGNADATTGLADDSDPGAVLQLRRELTKAQARVASLQQEVGRMEAERRVTADMDGRHAAERTRSLEMDAAVAVKTIETLVVNKVRGRLAYVELGQRVDEDVTLAENETAAVRAQLHETAAQLLEVERDLAEAEAQLVAFHARSHAGGSHAGGGEGNQAAQTVPLRAAPRLGGHREAPQLADADRGGSSGESSGDDAGRVSTTARVHGEELEAARSRAAAAEAALATADATAASVRAKLSQREDEVRDLQAEMRSLGSQLMQAESDLAEAEAQIHLMEVQLSNAARASLNGTPVKDEPPAAAMVEELRNYVAVLEGREAALQTELEDAKSDIEEAENFLRNVLSERASADGGNGGRLAAEEREHLERRIRELETEKAALVARVAEVEAQYSKAHELMGRVLKKSVALNARAEAAEAEAQRLQGVVDEAGAPTTPKRVHFDDDGDGTRSARQGS